MNKPKELEYRLLAYLGSCPRQNTDLGPARSRLFRFLFTSYLLKMFGRLTTEERIILAEIREKVYSYQQKGYSYKS